jgi:hypothetical protein
MLSEKDKLRALDRLQPEGFQFSIGVANTHLHRHANSIHNKCAAATFSGPIIYNGEVLEAYLDYG